MFVSIEQIVDRTFQGKIEFYSILIVLETKYTLAMQMGEYCAFF